MMMNGMPLMGQGYLGPMNNTYNAFYDYGEMPSMSTIVPEGVQEDAFIPSSKQASYEKPTSDMKYNVVIGSALYLAGLIASKGKINPAKWPVAQWAAKGKDAVINLAKKIPTKIEASKTKSEGLVSKIISDVKTNWLGR